MPECITRKLIRYLKHLLLGNAHVVVFLATVFLGADRIPPATATYSEIHGFVALSLNHDIAQAVET
jgi:hypothetical protein